MNEIQDIVTHIINLNAERKSIAQLYNAIYGESSHIEDNEKFSNALAHIQFAMDNLSEAIGEAISAKL